MHANPILFPTLVIAAILFWLGSALQKRASSKGKRVLLAVIACVCAIPGLLLVLYYAHLFDNAAWYYNLRVVRFVEVTACGLGFLGGVFHSWIEPEGLGGKLLMPAVVTVLVLLPFSKALIDPVDFARLSDRCEGEVCMQSTFSTCGPSSAATLLEAVGQNASERELARESFTSQGGTEIWYVARVLERRGLDTRAVIQPRDQISPPAPSIAGVMLPGGSGHFIAILSETPDEITIGDPLKGKLVVKRASLNQAYNFTGFFLTVRPREITNSPHE